MPESRDYILGNKTYGNYSGIELPEVADKASTFLKPLFRIGTGATAATGVKIGTTAIPLMDVQAVTSLTAGNSIPMSIAMTRLVESISGYDRGLLVTLSSEVKMPNVTAVKAIVDFGTAGLAHNRVAAVCAEVILPSTNVATRGEYSCIELEYVVPTCHANAVHSLIYMGVSGAALTTFDDIGYLFDIVGPTATNDGFFDEGGDRAGSGGLKIRINGVDQWVLISSTAP